MLAISWNIGLSIQYAKPRLSVKTSRCCSKGGKDETDPKVPKYGFVDAHKSLHKALIPNDGEGVLDTILLSPVV